MNGGCGEGRAWLHEPGPDGNEAAWELRVCGDGSSKLVCSALMETNAVCCPVVHRKRLHLLGACDLSGSDTMGWQLSASPWGPAPPIRLSPPLQPQCECGGSGFTQGEVCLNLITTFTILSLTTHPTPTFQTSLRSSHLKPPASTQLWELGGHALPPRGWCGEATQRHALPASGPSWSSLWSRALPQRCRSMQIRGPSPPSSPPILPALDHRHPSLTDSSAPLLPGLSLCPQAGASASRPPRAALMKGALGRVIQSGRSSELISIWLGNVRAMIYSPHYVWLRLKLKLAFLYQVTEATG